MIPEIKRFHSPDVDDLQHYKPDKPTNFCFLLQIIACPKGMECEESFDVVVCTPQWLVENIQSDKPLVGRHHLIVKDYNYDLIVRTIERYCEDCIGENWDECATMLGRLGKWEFEDYRE